MKFTRQHFIAPKDCPFTLNGENLASIRRHGINKIAKAIKVDVKDSKNETLGLVISRLKTMEAPTELQEILSG